MIKLIEKKNCCGCNACGDVCRQGAITFKTDIEGFWYPDVDKDKCVDCGLCEKTCPVLNVISLKKNDFEKPAKVLAAINRNMQIRWDSTSGGAFSALADAMYEQGGYVGGAIYNEDFSVRHFVSNNPDDLKRLRSSKYLQSNAQGFYNEVQSLLKSGKKVLVCGTPCQMVGLRAFLHNDYENLIIVDLICRGVNSPKVYRAYLDSLEREFGSKVVYVKAKNKELGWRNLTRKINFANGKSYYGIIMEDDFYRGFLHSNMFCRPSCYNCQFKGFPRIADITIGDYWGIERIDKNLDNNIGTSIILLNSTKGIQYFEKIQAKLEWKETRFEDILPGNPALLSSISAPDADRTAFFSDLDQTDFKIVAEKYFPLVQSRHIPHKKGLKLLRSKLGKIKRFVKNLKQKFGWDIRAYKNFYRINHRENTEGTWSRCIYTMPNAAFDIHPSAKIHLEVPVLFGNNPVKGMNLSSCLRMEENTVLEFHDGPLTRYGNSKYNLNYGAYIEVVNGGRLTIGLGFANVGLTIMCAKEVTI